MAPTKFCTLSRAALLLGLSPRTLLNWASQKIIPAYRPHPKGVYLVDIAEVEAAIKARAAHAQASPLTKDRFKELTDGFKEEIAHEKKLAMQQGAAKAKTATQHGQTVH